MNILIVDDERLARSICITYLNKSEHEYTVYEAEDTSQAYEILEAHSIDILILDIEMPEESGIEFVLRVKPNCHIIFATAYNEHAITAFEINAIDYLLKPFSQERFLEAIDKVKRLDQNMLNTMFESLQIVLDKKKHIDRIMIKDRDRIQIIKTYEIIAIEANGDYCNIITNQKTFLHHLALNALQDKLDPEKFVRIHRSSIINMDEIKEISLITSQKMTAIMSNNKEYDISRAGQQRIKDLTN